MFLVTKIGLMYVLLNIKYTLLCFFSECEAARAKKFNVLYARLKEEGQP